MKNKDVFISYKSEEYDEAEWVRSTLENNGVSCWMAPACIPGGSSYATEIPQAIRNCKVFVLILSEKSQLSKWVPRELDQAINESKIVLPFMLEDCALKDDFNFYLTNVQRYAAYKNKSEAFEKMLIRIKAVISSDKESTVKAESSDKKKYGEQEPSVKVSDEYSVKSERAEKARVIPDIPEILKEKEQPKRKSKKKCIFAVCAAAFVSLILIGIISSVLNTVEIAGKKYKTNDTTVSVYDAALTPEDIESIKKMKSISYIKLSNCTLPSTDLSWITDASTISIVNCGLTDEHIKTIDFSSLNLTSIDVEGNEGITDLSALKNTAETIRTVSFNGCSVSDISFAEDLTDIYSFYADSNGITDIAALEKCNSLQIISINNNSIDSLIPLSNCSQLSEVYANSNKLTSLKGLEKAIRLEKLEADNNIIGSLEGLNNATILEKLSLRDNDLTLISSEIIGKSAETLNELHIDGNPVSDFSPIGTLKKLNILTLDNCDNLKSLDFLEDILSLEWLSAANCSVFSINGLQNCTALNYLDLGSNRISSLEGLPSFTQPNIYLNLSNNLLTSVSFPKQGFSILSLYGNKLESLDISETNGSEIVIGYCEGFDYGTLSESFYSYYLIDIPLDKQVHISEAIDSHSLKFLPEDEYVKSLTAE